MHPVNLIARSLPTSDRIPLDVEPVRQRCCLTGQMTDCVPRKAAIGAAFTTQHLFAAPQSDWIGVDAFQALKYRPERTACWWCDGREFRVVKRAEIREIVLNGSPASPWAMWVTTSYKKHGSLLARVNHGGYGMIAFDELLVDNRKDWITLEWWGIMTTAQRAGIGRTMQESVACPPGLMGKIGLKIWMEFERWARPRAGAPLYKLLCYLLPSQEELKNAAAENHI